ncbi:GlxA family transcriptional regulator [Rhodobacteraceae bacterium B1Z28]|uniref:GlxA family transcriptional regulator n=2 Tax=Ruegeria haliotis TaxID=2747601 RepID=A0ABX2PWQ3_9RHOB|nr:GlxA family transcriptional regulator [Ruegeria haliotis]
MHSLSSATAPLSALNQMTGRKHYNWSLVSEQGGPVHSACGLKVDTGELDKPITPPAGLFVCDGLNGSEFYSPRTIKCLRMHAAGGGIVGSFGNGGYALAQAGLLRGKRFTVHWTNQGALTENYPLLEATDKVFEIDQKVLTCAGGLAAMDLMLAVVGRDFSITMASQIAELCLYSSPRTERDTQRAPLSAVLDTRNRILINTVQQMRNNLEFPLDLDEVAEAEGVSRRQLERLFRKFLRRSPGQYYKELRLHHARSLLHETDLTVAEIAFACGYNSISSFGKNFRSHFASGPSAYRGVSRSHDCHSHHTHQMEETS